MVRNLLLLSTNIHLRSKSRPVRVRVVLGIEIPRQDFKGYILRSVIVVVVMGGGAVNGMSFSSIAARILMLSTLLSAGWAM